MNAQQQIARPVETTMVEVSGTLEDGTVVTQTYPIQHAQGTAPGDILAVAFNGLRAVGGILVDNKDGSMSFFLGSKFIGPMKLEIQRVALITN